MLNLHPIDDTMLVICSPLPDLSLLCAIAHNSFEFSSFHFQQLDQLSRQILHPVATTEACMCACVCSVNVHVCSVYAYMCSVYADMERG